MLLLVGASLVAGLAASCGPEPSPATPDLMTAPKTGEVFEGVQCAAVRPQTEPDLMGWDSGSRLDLASSQKKGVVAVRYKAEGCNVELEILNCIGEGDYEFTGYSANESKVARSQRDLYADLPIGAARLGSKVGGGRALRTDYMLTGIYRIASYDAFPAAKLRGSGCADATHVVSKMYVGGFAMAAGVSDKLEASASLFGAGVGAAQDRSAERIAAEGNPEACERAQKEGKPEPLCSVPLRVGLVAIEGRAAGSCPAGSDWDGTACVQKDVRTEVVCPAGSKLENGACVATLSTACPAGMTFQAGRGCVANVVAPQAPPPSPAPASNPAAAASGRGPAMVSIPAGTFSMGSNDGNDHEKPVHQVRVGAFSMDVTEVTTAQYEACVRTGSCPPGGAGEHCNAGKADRMGHPINCVSWDDATAFCRWAGKRLPTEEEWEYAARGSDGRKFPWGGAAPSSQLCWKRGSSKQGTCAVGSFAAGKSPLGLQDIAGNVWEWTSSAYCPYDNKNCADAARVYRGGCWSDGSPSSVRASVRLRLARAGRNGDLGFRCAR